MNIRVLFHYKKKLSQVSTRLQTHSVCCFVLFGIRVVGEISDFSSKIVLKVSYAIVTCHEKKKIEQINL